jgi:hypothetical protein
MKKSVGVLFVGALVLPAAGISADAGELNVQGGTSTGGNASVIVGSPGTGLRFSVTGASGDVAILRDCFGNQIACLSIGDLSTLPAHRIAPLIRYDVLKIGQETRVMLGIAQPQPIFNGGSVSLTRGRAVIDSDPIVVR